MESKKRLETYSMQRDRGFTLIETIIVIALLLILTAIGMPFFAQWRHNIEYRQAARNIVQLLREARSTAIARNREHLVEFEPASRRFGLRAGNKAVKSNWQDVPPVADWRTFSPEVNMSSNVPSVQFNTNGTANGGTITVMDGNLVKKYDIVVNRTGRIRVDQINK